MHLENYRNPTEDQVLCTSAWLITQGVEEKALREAYREADFIATRDDLKWHEALHRVVNKSARTNKKGWESYAGDWVKFLACLKAYNLEDK